MSKHINYSYLTNSLPYKDELDKAFPETRGILDMFVYGNTFPVLTQDATTMSFLLPKLSELFQAVKWIQYIQYLSL